jgi:hypothetical protein
VLFYDLLYSNLYRFIYASDNTFPEAMDQMMFQDNQYDMIHTKQLSWINIYGIGCLLEFRES